MRVAPVYWILAAIVVLITLSVPRLRPVGILGCVVLGLMLAWGMVQRLRGMDATPEQRGKPVSPAIDLLAVPVESIQLQDLQLSGGGAPFQLRGRVTNESDLALKSVTLSIVRSDCYQGALDPSGCVVLWQDQHWLDVSVPPHESRDFEEAIWARGTAPRARGTVKDEFKLLSATGQVKVP
ncbi:MAG TPA: hypothetical protein VFS24_19360 [Steroidobacteraceae bacterium]|nr:hypothetical protein [Steroidobacteraceae bacterium]